MTATTHQDTPTEPVYVDLHWLATRWGVAARTARGKTLEAGFPDPLYVCTRPRWDRLEVLDHERRDRTRARARRVNTSTRPQYRMAGATGHTTVVTILKDAS